MERYVLCKQSWIYGSDRTRRDKQGCGEGINTLELIRGGSRYTETHVGLSGKRKGAGTEGRAYL